MNTSIVYDHSKAIFNFDLKTQKLKANFISAEKIAINNGPDGRLTMAQGEEKYGKIGKKMFTEDFWQAQIEEKFYKNVLSVQKKNWNHKKTLKVFC